MELGWPNLKRENPEASKGLGKPDLESLSPLKMGHGCTGMSAEMRQGMQVGQGVWAHSLLPPSPNICACPQDLVLMSEGRSGQPSPYSCLFLIVQASDVLVRITGVNISSGGWVPSHPEFWTLIGVVSPSEVLRCSLRYSLSCLIGLRALCMSESAM